MSDEHTHTDEPSDAPRGKPITRRDFLQGLATVPVLGLFGYALYKQIGYEQAQQSAGMTAETKEAAGNEVNVALLGVGAQGKVLLDAMLKIPGLRFRAVCDIWTEYHQMWAVNLLSRYNFEVNGYEDYREMLAKEQDLDAVVIATPDFWHARHAVDCLEAGLNVYCEKEMSNTLESARSMVNAARRTGKLLQIGHQRRSHPRYLHSYHNLLQEADILGRIVTANAQWNRSVQPDNSWPERYTMPADRLRDYGFDSMHQFRNWRWYRGLGGGPIVDLGSHQIDIFNWFLEAQPTAVTASGGTYYYPRETHEWYDTVMAIYEYETARGRAQAYYQTQTTNGSQGYFENFMGVHGTLLISESEAGYKGSLFREATAPPWDEWVRRGYVSPPKVNLPQEEARAVLDVRESVSPDEHQIPIEFLEPYHKPHLENFFNTIRGTTQLNCPAEIGYETAVAVLKVNEAIEAGRRLTFTPSEFAV